MFWTKARARLTHSASRMLDVSRTCPGCFNPFEPRTPRRSVLEWARKNSLKCGDIAADLKEEGKWRIAISETS